MKKNSLKQALIIFSVIFLAAKLTSVIWWAYFPSYWDTPFFKLIEFSDMICSAPVFFILSLAWIIYLFLPKKTSSNNIIQKSNEIDDKVLKINTHQSLLKKVLFIICLLILGTMIVRILLSPIRGYHSIAGFNGGGGSGTTYYGLKALEASLFVNFLIFFIVPVYPISLIYVVVYIYKNKTQKRESQNIDNVKGKYENNNE